MFEYLQPANRPVIEGAEACEIVMAKDQPEYIPLRCLRSFTPEGYRLSRWRLTAEQRAAVALGADIFLELMTFDKPMNPIRIAVSKEPGLEDFQKFYQLPKPHKGWNFLRWTGWNGALGRDVAKAEGEYCRLCNCPIRYGDIVSRTMNAADTHWLCSYPKDPQEHYVGHLVYTKGEGRDKQFCYVRVPYAEGCHGIYKPGEMLVVPESTIRVTDDTPLDARYLLVQEGLERMYAVIDQLEAESEPSTRHD